MISQLSQEEIQRAINMKIQELESSPQYQTLKNFEKAVERVQIKKHFFEKETDENKKWLEEHGFFSQPKISKDDIDRLQSKIQELMATITSLLTSTPSPQPPMPQKLSEFELLALNFGFNLEDLHK